MDQAARGDAEMHPSVISRAVSRFKKLLERRFQPNSMNNTFRLRMSNLGKPVCQLYFESQAAEREVISYDLFMRFMLGDLTEIVALAIIEGSGVNVQATDKKVSMDVAGTTINGAYDVRIDDEIWDIKSASSNQFKQKYGSDWGFANLQGNDSFGYISQGIAYAEGEGVPFKGWIAINKETGEIGILEIPAAEYEAVRDKALASIENTVKVILSGERPERCFTDEPEFFRNKATGNRKLGSECGWCRHKEACWPGIKHLPKAMSKASNPEYVWYTEFHEHEEDRHNG